MELKPWLEQTGLPVNETRFLKPPPLPYLVFLDSSQVYGADDCPGLLEQHKVRVELYAQAISRALEQKVVALLHAQGLEYHHDCVWIDSEKFFMSVYEFDYTEKIGR